jgi:hypothetical protein
MSTPTLVDPPSLKVTGEQYEAFVNALIDAFPSYPVLSQMARFRLDLHLERIAGGNTPIDQVAFLLIQDQKSKGGFLRLLDAARASRPANPQLASFAEQFSLAMQTPRRAELERVVRETNSFLDITTWRERLAAVEGCVCRVEVTTNAGVAYGTGFLVGPDLVLTNYHVIEAVVAGERNQFTAAGARAKTTDIILRFDYRETSGGRDPGTEARVQEIVDYSEYSPVDLQSPPKTGDPQPDQLDYALLRVSCGSGHKPIGERPIGASPEMGAMPRGFIGIPSADWTFQAQTPLFIVQHPEGSPLKLAFDTASILGVNGNRTRVTYTTNTLGGSSGSPCFNQHLDLIALHHAGDPKYGPMYFPTFNEGIPIAAIRERLRERGRTDGLKIV